MARKRGNSWVADVTGPDGKRYRRSFKTEAKAQVWEEETRVSLERGEVPIGLKKSAPYPSTLPKEVSKLVRLGTLYEHVCATRWAGTKAERERTTRALKCVQHFGEDRDIRTITSADVSEFRTTLAGKGASTSTVNRHVTALSTMLRTAVEEEALEKVPKMFISREEQTRFRYLDDREEAALLEFWRLSGDEGMADLTMFLIDTGARCFSEAMPVEWTAFSPQDRAVTFWQTKTGKPRTIPLTARLREMLARRRVAVGGRQGPFWGINEHTFKSRWQSMRGALGLSDVTPHTLRHTCCTRLVLGGADVKRVMTWMGHTAIQTTMRYMQMRPGDLEGVLTILEDRKQT